MKTVEITGTPRVAVGKSDTKKVRNQGNVPCVMYREGKEASHFSASHKALVKVLYSPEVYIVKVEVDGKVYDTIIREAQFHPVTDKILHVDFLQVDDKAEIEFELPVTLVGTPKGVFEGGKLVAMMRRLKVRGIPLKQPDKVEVDVTELELGKTIRVEHVNADGLVITSPPQAGIARVEIPRALRGKDEEGEEGEGESAAAAE